MSWNSLFFIWQSVQKLQDTQQIFTIEKIKLIYLTENVLNLFIVRIVADESSVEIG